MGEVFCKFLSHTFYRTSLFAYVNSINKIICQYGGVNMAELIYELCWWIKISNTYPMYCGKQLLKGGFFIYYIFYLRIYIIIDILKTKKNNTLVWVSPVAVVVKAMTHHERKYQPRGRFEVSIEEVPSGKKMYLRLKITNLCPSFSSSQRSVHIAKILFGECFFVRFLFYPVLDCYHAKVGNLD